MVESGPRRCSCTRPHCDDGECGPGPNVPAQGRPRCRRRSCSFSSQLTASPVEANGRTPMWSSPAGKVSRLPGQDLDAPDRSGLRLEPSGGRASGESDSSPYHPKRYRSDFPERNRGARSRLSSLRAIGMSASPRIGATRKPTDAVLSEGGSCRLRQSAPPRRSVWRSVWQSWRRSVLSAQGASACSQEQRDGGPDHGGF